MYQIISPPPWSRGSPRSSALSCRAFTHDFFGFIAQTAEHVFRKHGYLTIVSASGEDPVADPAAFLQRFYHMLDGVLLVPTAARLKDLESFDKPLLLVDRDMAGQLVQQHLV